VRGENQGTRPVPVKPSMTSHATACHLVLRPLAADLSLA
jgi:hypothetical protein